MNKHWNNNISKNFLSHGADKRPCKNNILEAVIVSSLDRFDCIHQRNVVA